LLSFDINKKGNTGIYHEEIVLSMGESLIIHPGKVIIGSTFEYTAIPTDLECQVEGRSSWARLGLVIATASTIEAGYKGMITLELSNIGKIPITLYPGLRIA
jgi:dCTP deaminase